MMRAILSLDIRSIAPRPAPIRPVDEDYAAALAVSMREASQLQPILVRPRETSDGPAYELVAGGHRLRAAQIAGLAFIDAEVRDLTDTEARIAEIDENVVRKELSALDRALSLAERKRLYEEAYPEARHGGDKGFKRAKKTNKNNSEIQVANLATWSRFSKDAAKKTGLSERSIQRAAELANSLDAETVQLLRGTRLADNAAALKKLAALEPPVRRDVAHKLGFGEARSIRQALEQLGLTEPSEKDPALALTARFIDLLSRTSAGQRRDWLLLILRHAKSGELPALANGLAERLPAKGKKLVLDALTALADAPDEAEAA